MTAFSDYLENKVLDHVLGGTARVMTSPGTVYVGLFTSGTNLEGGTLANEVSGGSYARVAATFGVAAGGVATNDSEIRFPIATTAWGIVTHAAVIDTSVYGAGNILVHSTLSSSVDIGIGDTYFFSIGDIQVTLT